MGGGGYDARPETNNHNSTLVRLQSHKGGREGGGGSDPDRGEIKIPPLKSVRSKLCRFGNFRNFRLRFSSERDGIAIVLSRFTPITPPLPAIYFPVFQNCATFVGGEFACLFQCNFMFATYLECKQYLTSFFPFPFLLFSRPNYSSRALPNFAAEKKLHRSLEKKGKEGRRVFFFALTLCAVLLSCQELANKLISKCCQTMEISNF